MTTNETPARRRLLKSVLLSMLVLAMGAAASYGLSQLRQPPELRAPADRKYNVEVYSVQSVDLREIINAFGTARPEKEVVLSAQVAGEVSETHPQLDVGSFKAGSGGLAGHDAGLSFLIIALSTPAVWLAMIGYMATFAVWMMILQRMDLSKAFPLTGLIYVTVPVLAWFGFGESLSPAQGAGIACIIGGVILLGRE